MQYASYYIKYSQFSLRASGASLQPLFPSCWADWEFENLENLKGFDPQTAEPQTNEIIL